MERSRSGPSRRIRALRYWSRAAHGGSAIGALASPGSTLEEMHLLTKVTRGLESTISISACGNPIFRRTVHRPAHHGLE